MFKDNKYTTWYFQICLNAKLRKIDGYIERHHIIPKSLGGSNKKENIVGLTAKEHFICHLLLPNMVETKDQKYKMEWALHRLTFANDKKYTSMQYELVRKKHSKNMKENHPSKRDINWSKKVSLRVKEYWNNNTERKKEIGENISLYWKNNKEKMTKIARENGKKANVKGRNSPRSINLNIEYKGNYYWNWIELRDNTGCSKHLYNKYYLNGIDPQFRIGKDGPVAKNIVNNTQTKGESVND